MRGGGGVQGRGWGAMYLGGMGDISAAWLDGDIGVGQCRFFSISFIRCKYVSVQPFFFKGHYQYYIWVWSWL